MSQSKTSSFNHSIDGGTKHPQSYIMFSMMSCSAASLGCRSHSNKLIIDLFLLFLLYKGVLLLLHCFFRFIVPTIQSCAVTPSGLFSVLKETESSSLCSASLRCSGPVTPGLKMGRRFFKRIYITAISL